MIFFNIFIISTIFSGCNEYDFENDFELTKTICIKNVVPCTAFYQYSYLDSDTCSYLYVDYLDTLRIVDLNNGVVFRNFSVKGNKEHSSQLFAISFDSIAYFQNYARKITIYNSFGIKMNEINFTNKDNLAFNGLFMSNNNQIAIFNNYLVTCVSNFSEYNSELEKKKKIVRIFDLKDSLCNPDMNYPPLYTLCNWGGRNMRFVYNCINVEDSIVVISLPASDSLYSYNLNTNKVKSYFAGINNSKKIRPLRKSKGFNPNSYEHNLYFFSTPSYGQVLYDKYRKCYYRFYESPILSKIEKNGFPKRSTRILTLDDSLRIISEAQMPMKYVNGMSFVNHDGLALYTIDVDKNDELVFHTFINKHKN